MSEGVLVYADDRRHLEKLERPEIPRAEVVDELYDAVARGRPALHTGEWGLATLEICLAVLRSATSGQEVRLEHQI